MIKMFLLSMVVVGIALLGMAVGVILSNRRLQGSCGGLGAIMGEDCLFCEKKEQCEKKKKEGDSPLVIDPDSGSVHLKLVD